jgi:hypothetical protein
MSEATRILGEAIGKPGLKYVQFSEDDARKAMTAGAGMSGSVVEAMLEMQRGFNAGIIRPTRERSVESTTTTLESFSKLAFAHAYRVAA